MPSKDKVDLVIKLLKKEYPRRSFPTNLNRDPFYVLVSCILSLSTRDEITFDASKKLFMLAGTPQEMACLDDESIRNAIYPVGFYNNKTRVIKEISRTLISKYSGKVPDTIEDLLKMRGIGRKTANIVITQAFRKHGIAVDVHVHVF